MARAAEKITVVEPESEADRVRALVDAAAEKVRSLKAEDEQYAQEVRENEFEANGLDDEIAGLALQASRGNAGAQKLIEQLRARRDGCRGKASLKTNARVALKPEIEAAETALKHANFGLKDADIDALVERRVQVAAEIDERLRDFGDIVRKYQQLGFAIGEACGDSSEIVNGTFRLGVAIELATAFRPVLSSTRRLFESQGSLAAFERSVLIGRIEMARRKRAAREGISLDGDDVSDDPEAA